MHLFSYCAKRSLFGLLVLTSASAASTSCSAEDFHVELQGGESYMDSHGTAAAFAEVMTGEQCIGSSSVYWQPVASLGWIDKRDIAHYDFTRYTTRHDAELVAGGTRFHYGDAMSWYRPLFFGFSVAYNQQATRALSSHYEFMSTLGWQGRHFSLQLRHISNGGLHDPNRGETMALAGVGFTL